MKSSPVSRELFSSTLPRISIFDSHPDPSLDHIVSLAAQYCRTPVAGINLITTEHQIFKATHGLDLQQPPVGHQLCRQALQHDNIFIINDISKHPLFAQEPFLIPPYSYRFYAGIRLLNSSDTLLGTLFIMGEKPQELTQEQQTAMQHLAQLAISHLELCHAHQRHQEDEQLNQLIIDSALDYAIITMTLDGLITSWNKGAEKLLGWSEKEIMYQPVDIMFTPQDRERNIPHTRRTSALHNKQISLERWHVRKDNSHFWASGKLLPLYNSEGKVEGFLKILNDRTLARNQQKRLREQAEMLRLAQEAGGIGAFDIDLRTKKMEVTDQLRRIYGIDQKVKVTPKVFEDLISDQDCHHKVRLKHSDLHHLPAHSEFRIIRPDNGEERWISRSMEFISDENNKIIRMRGVVQDITERKQASEQQAILTAELAHRGKNLLAIIQGIANQTLRSATTLEAAGAAFEARIQALSKAQDILTEGVSSTAKLDDLIHNSLHTHTDNLKRIVANGPSIRLGSRQCLAMIMALHELGTNAVKYGALSNDSGTISINWKIDDSRFIFSWEEIGGPEVKPPGRRGFGSRLIERTLAASLGGSAKLEYFPSGLQFHLDAPKITMID